MKTTITLENGNKFTFDEKTVKISGNPLRYELITLKEPKIGEKLEFEYNADICIDKFVSSSNIESITME